jgi:alpha-tubulin suppressor-like RCC1 family protein
VAAGFEHTAALKTDNTLWSWGRNDSGQLGVDFPYPHTTPIQVGTATNWAAVTAGEFDTIALATS